MNSVKYLASLALVCVAFACQAQPQPKAEPKTPAQVEEKATSATTDSQATSATPAQTDPAIPMKIGYTNVDYVLSMMPESKQIESDLRTYSTQLETQLQAKIKDYEGKMKAYEAGASAMTDVIRADKEKQIMNLRGEIEEFQKNADASIQKKQQTLLEPALDKLQKAIDKVAKENGYTYVFNSDAGYGTTPILLHGPDEHNISDLVLKSMGVTPPAKDAAKAGTATPAPAKPAVTPAPGTGKKKK
jgi:outer membrane protein